MIMKANKIGIFGVAFMYIGTIMGAGFASGREIWQFFGCFGSQAKIGVAVAGVLFILIGVFTAYIARVLNTNDMGKIIVPGNNKRLSNLVGYFMALILFAVLVTMSAAGGALFHQQFGGSPLIGGAIIILVVVFTVLGGFNRIAGIFRWLVPILLFVVVGVSMLVIRAPLGPVDIGDTVCPSPLSPTWYISAVLYLSYNILAVIPIVSTASLHAKNIKKAVIGAMVGGGSLAGLAYVLTLAMQKDMEFSQAMEMPLLAYTQRLGPNINLLYTIMLAFAIYASATTNFYGFTTKIKEGPSKKPIIIGLAVAAYIIGLVGFSNIVAYLFPITGFMGIVIVLMITTNFIQVFTGRSKGILMTKKLPLFENFPGHDRLDFPHPIYRVTAGQGGEALLIVGSEKTALMDCGMAYCWEQLLVNIETKLGGRFLDYIVLSHTHYDHIGALPYIKGRYKDALVVGSQHGAQVLEKPNALKLIKELGEKAGELYSGRSIELTSDNMKIEHIVCEGDSIDLGDRVLGVLETPGHTNCSLSFFLEPDGILFASESTGILVSPDFVHTAMLKSYNDSIYSGEKCQELGARTIILPHYGMLPEDYNHGYWKQFRKDAVHKKDFILDLFEKGFTLDEMTEKYLEKYWSDEREQEQPKPAFLLNAKNIIQVIIKEFT
jgi:uncharacterized membrane protein YkvI/glyoxylase-like metal-dependent hydrolase (beta-lactamase superfamily II)